MQLNLELMQMAMRQMPVLILLLTMFVYLAAVSQQRIRRVLQQEKRSTV